jgi:hypothetical protein
MSLDATEPKDPTDENGMGPNGVIDLGKNREAIARQQRIDEINETLNSSEANDITDAERDSLIAERTTLEQIQEAIRANNRLHTGTLFYDYGGG